jgi:hypothetical protein
MQLSVARLCLDCQEIHEEDRCPICTSEAFAFMTRWVKIDAPSQDVSSTYEKQEGAASKVEAYRRILNPAPQRSAAAGWLRRGSLVVAVGYLARWGWQIAAHNTRRSPQDSESNSAGSQPDEERSKENDNPS